MPNSSGLIAMSICNTTMNVVFYYILLLTSRLDTGHKWVRVKSSTGRRSLVAPIGDRGKPQVSGSKNQQILTTEAAVFRQLCDEFRHI
jgi:hypothetical protein